MLESLILALFALALFTCVGTGLNLLWALLAGWFLFSGYALYRKHPLREVLGFSLSGIRTVKNILVTFVLIGVITALWRLCGTIPTIVYHAAQLCTPRIMVLMTFLLCCLISFLTGTAFGTAATMGVICVTMANGMGVPILFSGGAVLAGSYFGDRCSPMSTSALLVSTLTKTDLYHNLQEMVKTSLVPFFLSCCIYYAMGAGVHTGQNTAGLLDTFRAHFSLHPAAVLPAAVIVILSLFRVNVKYTMTVSILCGAAIALGIEGVSPGELFTAAVLGYHPDSPELATVLSGGGILSMVRVFSIVCISSCYAGLFTGTGMLRRIQDSLARLCRRITPYGGFLVTSVLTGAISCNQTLTIMLTHQLCASSAESPEAAASYLENTAAVTAVLIPWSIAGAVPLDSVGAPAAAISCACYLYLLPLWNLAMALIPKNKTRETV